MSIRAKTTLFTVFTALVALLAIPQAFGAAIYVNGTQVDGALSNATLEKCTAVFDGNGDLKLNCPGYNFAYDDGSQAPAGAPASQTTTETSSNVATPPLAPALAPSSADKAAPIQLANAPKLGASYILFSSQSGQPGAAGYDVDVFINGTLAVRVKNDDVQVVEDVSRYLKKGANSVTFVARKTPNIRQVTPSANDAVEIQITEGSLSEDTGTLTISAGTGITYRINATETSDSTKEMKLMAR